MVGSSQLPVDRGLVPPVRWSSLGPGAFAFNPGTSMSYEAVGIPAWPKVQVAEFVAHALWHGRRAFYGDRQLRSTPWDTSPIDLPYLLGFLEAVVGDGMPTRSELAGAVVKANALLGRACQKYGSGEPVLLWHLLCCQEYLVLAGMAR